MHRFAMNYLFEWKKEENRKPLIIRGARQVGKSYLAKEFGRTFKYFAEINFESMPELNSIFENNLNPEDILDRDNDSRLPKKVNKILVISPKHQQKFIKSLQKKTNQGTVKHPQ